MAGKRKWLILVALALVLIALFLCTLPRSSNAAARAGGPVAAAKPGPSVPLPGEELAASNDRPPPEAAAAPPASMGAAWIEVDKRIKASELKRAELVENGSRHGKHVIAFAIKQPTAAEIREIFAPFEALRKSVSNPEEAATIQRQIEVFRTTYGLTDGSWRSLILIIPEDRTITPYGQSAPASSRAGCAGIVDEMVVPREREIGVPYQGVPGTSYNFQTIDANWRFSALVDRGDLKRILESRKSPDGQNGGQLNPVEAER